MLKVGVVGRPGWVVAERVAVAPVVDAEQVVDLAVVVVASVDVEWVEGGVAGWVVEVEAELGAMVEPAEPVVVVVVVVHGPDTDSVLPYRNHIQAANSQYTDFVQGIVLARVAVVVAVLQQIVVTAVVVVADVIVHGAVIVPVGAVVVDSVVWQQQQQQQDTVSVLEHCRARLLTVNNSVVPVIAVATVMGGPGVVVGGRSKRSAEVAKVESGAVVGAAAAAVEQDHIRTRHQASLHLQGVDTP